MVRPSPGMTAHAQLALRAWAASGRTSRTPGHGHGGLQCRLRRSVQDAKWTSLPDLISKPHCLVQDAWRTQVSLSLSLSLCYIICLLLLLFRSMSKYMLGVVCPNHTVADVKLHGGVGINPAVHQSLYNCSYVRQLEVFSLFSSFSFERSLSLLTSLPRDRESASRLSNGSWSALGLLDLIRPFVVQRICLFSVAWRCLVNWCIQCRHGPIALIYIYIYTQWMILNRTRPSGLWSALERRFTLCAAPIGTRGVSATHQEWHYSLHNDAVFVLVSKGCFFPLTPQIARCTGCAFCGLPRHHFRLNMCFYVTPTQLTF